MREIIISTETNSDMSEEFLSKNNILVIPHYYNVEEKMYGGDGDHLTIKEFYDEMRAGKKVGTAASNPAVILDEFTKAAAEGKDIIHISFSSGLSGGYQNVVNGASEVMEEYPDCRIEVIDTLSASLGEGLMLELAVRMKNEGASFDDIVAEVKKTSEHISIQFTVDSLEYLYRGGRLSKTSATLGTMINLKPVLHIDDEGKLVAVSKVRGRRKSLSTMLANMEAKLGSYKDKQIFIGIMHGDCEEEALALRDMVKEKFGYENFVIEPIGPSIGAHSGPGTMGLVFLGDER